jgi:hypothetical protein
VYSHPGHRSTSFPEDKTSFLPIVVANIILKSEAGIFGSAAVSMAEFLLNNRLYKNSVRTSQETSRDSAVRIATGYGMDGRGVGVRVPEGERFFSSLHRPCRLWSPLRLLCNGYRAKAAGA